MIELLTAKNNVERILGMTEKEKNRNRSRVRYDNFSPSQMNSRRRRRLKRAGANAPALLGVWGHQPPTSTRRVYTRALLAAT